MSVCIYHRPSLNVISQTLSILFIVIESLAWPGTYQLDEDDQPISPRCTGIHSVDQNCLELRDPLIPASRVLELKECGV